MSLFAEKARDTWQFETLTAFSFFAWVLGTSAIGHQGHLLKGQGPFNLPCYGISFS